MEPPGIGGCLVLESHKFQQHKRMFLAPANNQIDLAYDLIRSGASMFLAALCWGTTIYSSKYPRLALYAHTQGTNYGVQMIVLGLLLSRVEFVGKLTPWEVYAVWGSQVVGWPMWFSQLAQSFWGTNKMNSLV